MLETESGRLPGGWSTYGRYSRIETQGYREHSWSKLWSYAFVGAARGRAPAVPPQPLRRPRGDAPRLPRRAAREPRRPRHRRRRPRPPLQPHRLRRASATTSSSRTTSWSTPGRRAPGLTALADPVLVRRQGLLRRAARRPRAGRLPARALVRRATPRWSRAAYYAQDGARAQPWCATRWAARGSSASTWCAAAPWPTATTAGSRACASRTRGGALTVGGELRAHDGRHWGEVVTGDGLPPGTAPGHTYYDYHPRTLSAALLRARGVAADRAARS